MKIAVFSAKSFDREFLGAARAGHPHELVFVEESLSMETVERARGCPGVCAFVTDQLSSDVLGALAAGGTRLVTLRSAGYDHVDLEAAARHGIVVARVPAYSPHAIAELAVGLVLALDRGIHRAWARVREGNFSLDGLLGFDLRGKILGVVGTGNIGSVFCRIMGAGFGCQVLAHDIVPSDELRQMGVEYTSLHHLLHTADIVSLHVPLTSETRYMIDDRAIGGMKRGAMLINTSRGAVVDTAALIRGLETGRISAAGLDVYEGEGSLFFRDFSKTGIPDPLFRGLVAMPGVLVTGHQGFFTREALENIADTTLANATAFETGEGPLHVVP